MTDVTAARGQSNGTTPKGAVRSAEPAVKSERGAVAGGYRWDGPGTRLARVILPRTGDPVDVRALYLDEDKGNLRRTRTLSRTSAALAGQSSLSFATYFNAFPASYWRHWTTLSSVELRLLLEGNCRVDVYRSLANGVQVHVCGQVVEAAAGVPTPVWIPLDLAPFVDGGWYWFDLTSDSDVTLHEAGWYAPVEAPGRTAISVGICTFNRPGDCVSALRALGEDDDVRDGLAAVWVADQGDRKVRDEATFAEAQARLGERLRIVEQPNLGGSGGFSRVMYESLRNTDCEQLLLLDDDILIEPDALLRAAVFARFAERPMIVGGQMLSLTARSVLHTMGEVIDRDTFMWRGAPNSKYGHDFKKYPLRHPTKSVNLHRRVDVDYNGWWMCMIPRVVAEQAGLPLPLFIKWDDSEYGLRAAKLGYPTATLPGAAIWHMSWDGKDDGVDWQAYFHLRNRLVVAALHSPHNRLGGLIRHSLKDTLKHLLSLQYSTVALRQLAIEDFLKGPEALFASLSTALSQVRTVRGEFSDARVLNSPRELPLPSMSVTRAERFLKVPTNPVTIGRRLVEGLVHNVAPAKTEHHAHPQLNVAGQDALWFLMSRLDGATVGTADGRGVTFRKRDPKLFWGLLKVSLLSHARLARSFPRLRRTYRGAADMLTGAEQWEKTFGIVGDQF